MDVCADVGVKADLFGEGPECLDVLGVYFGSC